MILFYNAITKIVPFCSRQSWEKSHSRLIICASDSYGSPSRKLFLFLYKVSRKFFETFSKFRLLFLLEMATRSTEPEGDLVSPINAIAPSIDDAAIKGQHVTLTPLLESHAAELYSNLGAPQDAALYKYLPTGPYSDLPSFTAHINNLGSNRASLFPYAILSSDPIHRSNASSSSQDPTAVGIICLMNIHVPNRSIEIGNVLFPTTFQRSTAATEAVFLLMKLCFNDLHFSRVEWKCNSLNKPSKRAALRLGFVFEGVFRKHMVIKGRRRDTAWFSVIDDEWKASVGEALIRWLSVENFGVNGGQTRKLEEIREKLMAER